MRHASVITRGLVYAILLLAPWLFGSTEQWALMTLRLLTALAVLVNSFAVINANSQNTSITTDRAPSQCGLRVAWLLVAFYLVVQALNASHVHQGGLGTDGELAPRNHFAWLPHSADATATWQALTQGLMYAGLFWVVRTSFQNTKQVQWLLCTLVSSGFVMALSGILLHLSHTPKLLGIRYYTSSFFGPFVNTNNAAAYLNLLFPLTLAVGRQQQRCAITQTNGLAIGFLHCFLALIMALAVIITRSRAGLMLCVLSLALWLISEIRLKQNWSGGSKWRLLVAVGGGLLAIGSLMNYCGWAPLYSKWQEPGGGFKDWIDRIVVYRSIGRLIVEHWFYGVGAGTFLYVFPYYQPETILGFWRYGHNDWLQGIAELGLVGVVLIGVGVWLLWRQNTKWGWLLRMKGVAENAMFNHLLPRRLATGIMLGGLSVILHGLVDFPLQIAGVTTLAVAYAALLTVPDDGKHSECGEDEKGGHPCQ